MIERESNLGTIILMIVIVAVLLGLNIGVKNDQVMEREIRQEVFERLLPHYPNLSLEDIEVRLTRAVSNDFKVLFDDEYSVPTLGIAWTKADDKLSGDFANNAPKQGAA